MEARLEMIMGAVCTAQGPEAMGVLQAIEDWAQTSPDPSLVRSFVWQTLALAAPPYASDFAAFLVRYTLCIALSWLLVCTAGEHAALRHNAVIL